MAWHGYLPRYALDLLIFDSCTLAHWLVFKWKISFPNLPFHVWFESEPGSLAMICFHFRSIRRTQTQKFSQKFSHSTPQLSPCSSPSARLMSQMNLYVSRCERFFPTEPGYQVPGTGVPFKEADSRNHGNHVQVTKCPLADHPIRESVVETNPIERDRDVLWSSEGLRLEAFNFSNFSMDFPVVLEICTGILDETPTTACLYVSEICSPQVKIRILVWVLVELVRNCFNACIIDYNCVNLQLWNVQMYVYIYMFGFRYCWILLWMLKGFVTARDVCTSS